MSLVCLSLKVIRVERIPQMPAVIKKNLSRLGVALISREKKLCIFVPFIKRVFSVQKEEIAAYLLNKGRQQLLA